MLIKKYEQIVGSIFDTTFLINNSHTKSKTHTHNNENDQIEKNNHCEALQQRVSSIFVHFSTEKLKYQKGSKTLSKM